MRRRFPDDYYYLPASQSITIGYEADGAIVEGVLDSLVTGGVMLCRDDREEMP